VRTIVFPSDNIARFGTSSSDNIANFYFFGKDIPEEGRHARFPYGEPSLSTGPDRLWQRALA